MSEVQAAIGWRLRAEYALEQSMPARSLTLKQLSNEIMSRKR